MNTIKKHIGTNSSLIKSILTNYKNTFFALCELINNSLQATATEINIKIDYDNSDLTSSSLKSIIITDNGYGVSYSEFDSKILDIGTTVKVGGQGIGRFGALQIGTNMEIETVGYDENSKKFSIIKFTLNANEIADKQLNEIEFNVEYDFLDGQYNPYYKVTIKDLYHNSQEKVLSKSKIVPQFLESNIRQSIFERYPTEVFNKNIRFFINGLIIQKDEFIIGTPNNKIVEFTTKKGRTENIDFCFYNISLPTSKVKVFFRINNGGIQTVAHEYTYSSDWYTPDLGTWYIYLDSPLFDSDLFRNLDLDSLGEEEIKRLKDKTKDVINEFFKAKNKRFEKFVKTLETDHSYPYRKNKPASLTQEVLFKKIAYLVEDEYQLLKKDDKIRNLLYPLINRVIENGDIEETFIKLMKLSDEGFAKFHSLLEKTDIEDVVSFTSKVACKLEFLDFLHELIYGDISSVLKERSQLHKIIEKELWLFGEAYNGMPTLWSDKKIGNILEELRNKYFNYNPSIEDDNLVEIKNVEGIDNITDLFFYSNKILDDGKKEILIVELKSPKCAISRKEIQQIDDYAFTVETFPGLPTENVKYKFILISSKLTAYSQSKLKAARERYGKPFLYDCKTGKDIEIYVMEWSEIIELNKRRLGYLSESLQIKDKSVKDKFEEEYPNILDEKVSARLTRNNS
jgi:hypothetical protein